MPKLHAGGLHESRYAKLFTTFDPLLAAAFKAIDGVYYERARPSMKQRSARQRVIEQMDEAIAKRRTPHAQQYITRLAHLERQAGIPVPISNFTLESRDTILKRGVAHCYVTAYWAGGVIPLLTLKPSDYRTVKAFQDWCLRSGCLHWQGSQKHLEMLIEDLDPENQDIPF